MHKLSSCCQSDSLALLERAALWLRLPLMLLGIILVLSGCGAPAAPADAAVVVSAKATTQALATVEKGSEKEGGEKRFPPLPKGFKGPVTYDVVERMRIVNHGPGEPSKQHLWVALIGDVLPYQTLESLTIKPDNYQLIEDEYGNHYAEFDLTDMPPGSEVPIEIRARVTVNGLDYELAPCVGAVPNVFNKAELHVESNNPQIKALAEQLSQKASDPCEQARAFYNYVGDQLVYTYNANNWGAQAALGEMGADCTEYASLTMALSRAAGIPARYLEGLSYPINGAADLARTEHSWLEVYLPGNGWIPVDPTMGRSSLTREQYFAKMPPNHIIITRGRNPSTLRGASYWTHLYWPGNSTDIRVEDFEWDITPEAVF